MTAERSVCRRVVIHGRVQGVGYRAWVEAETTAIGLSGFVRNHRDGTVEAMFCGASNVVADMIERCRRGPRHAQVTQIEMLDVDDDASAQHSENFSVLPTI
jgi:acylphosphatase